mmetsp:Transcript_1801/g.5371  ORF Transcript_1801/g.5371 Transcript_1801/m.5371 type:complete len:431 (-) Transcript_1801:3686-4978(-)
MFGALGRLHPPLLLRKRRQWFTPNQDRRPRGRALRSRVGAFDLRRGQRLDRRLLRRRRRHREALRLCQQRRRQGRGASVRRVHLRRVQPDGGHRRAGELELVLHLHLQSPARRLGGSRSQGHRQSVRRDRAFLESRRLKARRWWPFRVVGPLRRVHPQIPVQGQVRVHVLVALAGHREAPRDGHANRVKVALRLGDHQDQHLPGPVRRRQHDGSRLGLAEGRDQGDAPPRRFADVQAQRGGVGQRGQGEVCFRQSVVLHRPPRRRARARGVRRQRDARHRPHGPHLWPPAVRAPQRAPQTPRRVGQDGRGARGGGKWPGEQKDCVPFGCPDHRGARLRHGIFDDHFSRLEDRLARAEPAWLHAPLPGQKAAAPLVRNRDAAAHDALEPLHLRAVGARLGRGRGAEPRLALCLVQHPHAGPSHGAPDPRRH